ncbi:CHRD domain-containing protein [Crateriforma conspicua]|uniref:CHRD domain-containing protein n=1 Tax=Crateriforma conspicua TaxID=2527996 RepID=UPI00118AFA4F|nr:CHRD domain-containing protein [Crateriforma conspicua]QDV66268.1 CHRD domain protein [Crateriforma conspicua]
MGISLVRIRAGLIAMGCVVLLGVSAGSSSAALIDFQLEGNAGIGLLPGNEVGANTPIIPGSVSNASGGESGGGFFYDTDTNVLNFEFTFQNLSGGLANVASGIHLHVVSAGSDIFNSTGGIAFNLNSGADANVTLSTPTIAFGATGGTLAGTVTMPDQAAEDALLDGRYYVNIHSGSFGGGELRGSVTAVPEPASMAFLGAIAVGGVARRVRRNRK